MLHERVDSSAIAQWCQRLDEHSLPVMTASANALHKALKQPDVALHDLGTIIASDPVMSLSLLRECQRQFGQRVEGSLSNIHHCVAMLGLDKTLILARTFRPLTPSADPHTDYLTALGTSLHAAEQARQWLLQRHSSGADQAWLAALLLGLVDAALWQSAPREMHALQVLQWQESIPDTEAELAVLGCTRPQLARALAQRWRFPVAVLDAIDPLQLAAPAYLLRHARRALKDHQHKLPNRDSGGQLIRSQALYVRLAHGFARLAGRDWHSKALQRCHTILAACLFLDPQETRQLTQDTALQLSRHWPLTGVSAPAEGLLWPLQTRRRRRIKPAQLPAVVARLLEGKTLSAATPARPGQPTGAPRPAPKAVSPPRPAPPRTAPVIGLTSTNLPADLDRSSILNAPPRPAPAVAAPRFAGFKSDTKKQAFEHFINRLLTEPDSYNTEYDVLRAAVEHLHDCTDLSRVVVALHNPKLDQIEGYFALGCEQYPGLKRFRVKLQPVNLFTHLLKQPAGLWLSPERPNSANGLIPGSFKQASQTDTCFLMSIFNHKGPYGVLYADRGLNDRVGLSDYEYKIFKATSAACSKHLTIRGRRALAKPGEP